MQQTTATSAPSQGRARRALSPAEDVELDFEESSSATPPRRLVERRSQRLRRASGLISLAVAAVAMTGGALSAVSAQGWEASTGSIWIQPEASATTPTSTASQAQAVSREVTRPELAPAADDIVLTLAERTRAITPPPTPSPSPSAAAKPAPSATKKATPAKASTSAKATTTAAGGLSAAACPSGSAMEKGLKANAVAVHRAVCAKFPSITSYGGVRSGTGYHAQGRAVDIMVSGSRGTEVTEFLMANYSRLGVIEVIYQQRIWMPGKGWKAMEDRGSVTENHYDHVHVSVSA